MNKLALPKHYLILLVISIAVFYPSFFLHFDGDSYLTLWRFEYNTTYLGKSILSNFFTDYGPQDTTFAMLYSIFGFKPFYFYLLSFTLRYLASITLYHFIKVQTKKDFPSLLGTLLFVISTAGLETTNWVFNVTSYLAIIILNLLLINIEKKQNLINTLLSVIGFLAAILVQPIRMAFLPIFLIFHLLFKSIYKKTYTLLPIIFLFLVTFVLLFAFGNIGDSVGVSGNVRERLSGNWSKTNNVNANMILKSFEENNYKVLLYPIGQIGKVIIPDTIFEIILRSKNVTNPKLLLIETVFFTFILSKILRANFTSLSKSYIPLLATLFWSLTVYYLFNYNLIYPLNLVELLSFAIGGQLIIFSACLIFYTGKSHLKPYLLSSIVLMFIGFIIPWSRSPNSLLDSTSRYLIISSLGMAWFISLVNSILDKNTFVKKITFILIILNVISSYSYLDKLKLYRGYQPTENIRNSIPTIDTLSQNQTTLFYFETNNNERLYHSLYFGFPVMMHYYQDVKNIWNVAYTTEWSEVVSAYKTGESLKRFGTIEVLPIKLKNIYSFKLIDNNLIETTLLTRDKLRVI